MYGKGNQKWLRGRVLSIGIGVYQHPPESIVIADRHHFALPVTVEFGVEGEIFTELIQFTVCSPSWIDAVIKDDALVRGEELMIMRTFDARKLRRGIENFAGSCLAPSVAELFQKMGRIGYSEMDDLDEPPALRQYLGDGDSQRYVPFQQVGEDGVVRQR